MFSNQKLQYETIQHSSQSIELWEYYQEDLDEAAKKIYAIEKRFKYSRTDATDSSLQPFSDVLENDLDTPKALELLTTLENQTLQKKLFLLLGFII